VSGKGLPASLLMANLQATLRGQTIVANSPKTCLERSNRLLFESTSPEKFATLFYAILDTQDHRLCYSNAGHEHPFLLSTTREPTRLKTGGIPLGMINEFTFEEESLLLNKGDAIVIYSDGVSEAMTEDEEMFGEKRITDVINGHRDASPSQLIDHVVEAVKQFTSGYPQTDDITVVVISRNRN
jgi:sigma-B regulation protein RsbU (phosphoserine phosphatase)